MRKVNSALDLISNISGTIVPLPAKPREQHRHRKHSSDNLLASPRVSPSAPRLNSVCLIEVHRDGKEIASDWLSRGEEVDRLAKRFTCLTADEKRRLIRRVNSVIDEIWKSGASSRGLLSSRSPSRSPVDRMQSARDRSDYPVVMVNVDKAKERTALPPDFNPLLI